MNNNTLALGGVTLLAGAFLSVYQIFRRKDPSDLRQVEILTRSSYSQIIRNIQALYSEMYYQNLLKTRQTRREIQADSKQYKKVVQKFNNETQAMLDKAISEVLSQFRVSRIVFENSKNYFNSDLELQELTNNLVYPIYSSNSRPAISKQETKYILEYFAQRLEDRGADKLNPEEYMIVSSQIEDEISKKTGFEIEEVNAAYEDYNNQQSDYAEPMQFQTFHVPDANNIKQIHS